MTDNKRDRRIIGRGFSFNAKEFDHLLEEYERNQVISLDLLRRIHEMLENMAKAITAFGIRCVLTLVGEKKYDRFLEICNRELPETFKNLVYMEDYRK